MEIPNCATNIQDNVLYVLMSKYDTFIPIIETCKTLLSNDINKISICCPSYSDDGLKIGNRHKYEIILTKQDINVFLNDEQIDINGYEFITNTNEVHCYFILDMFKLFPNIMRCNWSDEPHEYHYSCYGTNGGYYQRIGTNFVKIVDYGGCAHYSGGESLVDLKTNKTVASGCMCFGGIGDCDALIQNHNCNSDDEVQSSLSSQSYQTSESDNSEEHDEKESRRNKQKTDLKWKVFKMKHTKN